MIIISADVPTRNEKPIFGVLNLPLFNYRMRKAGLDEQAVMLYVFCMSTLTLSCLCSALTDSFGHSFFVDMFNSEIAELAWYSEKCAFGARQKCKHHLGCWHEFADTSLCPSWPIREVTSYLQPCSSCQDYGFHSRDRWLLSPRRLSISKLVRLTENVKVSICPCSGLRHFQCTHIHSAPPAFWPAICPFSTMHCGIPLLNPRVKIECTFPAAITSTLSSQRPVTHPNYPSPPKAGLSLWEPY